VHRNRDERKWTRYDAEFGQPLPGGSQPNRLAHLRAQSDFPHHPHVLERKLIRKTGSKNFEEVLETSWLRYREGTRSGQGRGKDKKTRVRGQPGQLVVLGWNQDGEGETIGIPVHTYNHTSTADTRQANVPGFGLFSRRITDLRT
jgi:hypothetical protein